MRKFGLKKQLGALPERKDYILTLAVLAVACVLSGLLVNFDGSSYVQLIFVLAVAVISRFTNGYLCGLISSLLGMFAVNYAFTYPYFKLNFSITGYPVTFATMLLVTVIIGMLTSQLKSRAGSGLKWKRKKQEATCSEPYPTISAPPLHQYRALPPLSLKIRTSLMNRV